MRVRVMVSLAVVLGLVADARAEDRPGEELLVAQVRALEVAALGPGESGELSLILLESPDRDMPLAVRIDGDGVELVDNRLGWSAVVDPLALQPRLSAAFVAPGEAGRYEVRASVDYSLCSARWCRTKHAELSWTVVVEASDAS